MSCGKVEDTVYYCRGCNSSGTVWGSNPYTSDSDKCRAARHFGTIDINGGYF